MTADTVSTPRWVCRSTLIAGTSDEFIMAYGEASFW